jgi:hypothetical protein
MFYINTQQGGYRIVNIYEADIYSQITEILNTETKPLLIRGGVNFRDYFTSVSSIRKIGDNYIVPLTDVGKNSDGAFTHVIATIEPSNMTISEEEVSGTSGSVNPATTTSLGVVQIGDNIEVDDSGIINIPIGALNKLGVMGVDNTLITNNGIITASVNSLLNNQQVVGDPATAILKEFSLTNPSDSNHTELACGASSEISGSGVSNVYANWNVYLQDTNTFIGYYSGSSAPEIKSANSVSLPLLINRSYFLVHRVTIDSIAYYIRVPVKLRLLTSYGSNGTEMVYYLTAYLDFNFDSTTNFTTYIPTLNVGKTGTYSMTYQTAQNQIIHHMRQFNVIIKMPDGNRYQIKDNGVFVQNGCVYMATVEIDLTATSPALTDTFATYTFTRIA